MTASKTLIRTVVALAAVLVVGAAASGCGNGSSSGQSKASGNATDRAFVAGMTPHHRSAIEMAQIAQQRAQSQFVKQLAGDIIASQSREIATLSRLDQTLAQEGVKPGDLGVSEHMMGMNMDMTMLRSANPFDRAFIDMMVPHHQGAVRMARVEVAKGQNPQLKRLAQAIIDAQSREIREMNAHRSAAYGGPSPAGGVPAAGETTSQGQGGHSGMSGMHSG